MSQSKALGWLVVVLFCGACAEEKLAEPVVPGEIIGRVEVSAGVSATGCLVLVEGTPLAARCDDAGTFDLKRVPPGRWDLRILPDSDDTSVPARRIAAAANPGFVSDLGAIPLAKPGSIGGRVNPPDGTQLDVAVVAIPDLGAVTAPNAGGAYLLDEVPPGVHNVTLITTNGTVVQQKIRVLAGRTTIGINFDLAELKSAAARVSGRALRSTRDRSGHAGVIVELVETRNGTVVKTASTGAEGGFQLEGPAGTYIVRARDEGNPATAVIPAVVLYSEQTVTLSSALVLPAAEADLDGDAVGDTDDDDIDGDGVPNSADVFPRDPAETGDKDKDGVGDRSDLKSEGGSSIDHRVPTPDTDQDGQLDFEDNCPKDANRDQLDSDQDEVGDACDTCPTLANPDQTGLCIQCIDNDQCGGQVCNNDNRCVDCTDSIECHEGRTCNPQLGLCVQCTQNTDCGLGRSCILGNCVAQCKDDLGCPGGYCQNGTCVACRSNLDCSNDLWCDSGRCRPQCLNNGDCTGRRTCDPDTKTCVLPCGEDGCADGQICQDNICRTVCDGARPCPAGQLCDAATSSCRPECKENLDCAAIPHSVCTGGQCVPDGSCVIDTDCPSSQLCTAGTCLNRPTVLDPELGYRCAGACDCRMGEICAAGHCVGDFIETIDRNGSIELKARRPLGTPTLFLAQSGTGDGTAAQTPSGNLGDVLARLQDGDIVALNADLSAVLSAPAALTRSRVVLAGGYLTCGPNRWVRDANQRARIASSKTGIFTLLGNGATTYEDVTIANLDLEVTDTETQSGRTMIDAAFAPRLLLKDLSFKMAFPTSTSVETYVGVACSNCNDIQVADLSMPSHTLGKYHQVSLLSLTDVSGNIARVAAGFVALGRSMNVIQVKGTTGPLTIAEITSEGTATHSGAVPISVADCGSKPDGTGYPLSVRDSHLAWNMHSANTSVSDAVSQGIHVTSCSAVNVRDNVIDGTGQSDTDINAARHAIQLDNCDGVVADNTVYFPTLEGSSGTEHTGYAVMGPRGNLLFTGNTSGGGSAPTLYLLHITNVTSGVVRLRKDESGKNNVLGANFGTTINRGLYVENSYGPSGSPAVIVEDAEFHVNVKGCNQADGFYITSAAVRIERSKFYALQGGQLRPGYVKNGELELYSSYLAAGTPVTPCTYSTYGLHADSGSLILATGNTLDSGGGLSAGGYSYGVYCDTSAKPTFYSNLISGGISPSHAMFHVPSTAASECLKPDNFHNNYFWYARSGDPTVTIENVGTIATGAIGQADTNGNIVGNSKGCYDALLPQPDYRLAADSPCIDAGTTTNRRFLATPVTLDIDGKDRTVTAPDIGCSELK